MKYVVAVVMVGLAVATTLLPGTEPRQTPSPPASEVPPVAICPLVQTGDTRTDVSVLSSVNGVGRLSSFAAGSEIGATEFRTGGTGAVTVPASEADVVDVAGGLIEMPSETTAAGVVTSSPTSLSAEGCADLPTGQSFISGGSTISGSFFQIQLLNPYAGEAIVDLSVSSDAGLESDSRFDAVIVPPLSTITLDLTQIIPGRDQISVRIEASRGSVLPFGRQITDGRTALWRAVEPGQDWWLPVPPGGATKQMRIATSESAEVEYQIDLYGPEGFVEGYDTGVISERGSVTVPLDAITQGAAGVRVITTGPVVPTLWVDSPDGFARTTASQVDAPVWLLPGAGSPIGGTGTVTILNSGIETVDVSVRSMADTAIVRELEVAAEGVLTENLVAANGYRIEATGPVVALWTSTLNGTGTAAVGFPLQDG